MMRRVLGLIVAAGLLGVTSTSALAHSPITEFTLAPPADKNPEFIVDGPDENLWFSLSNGSHIGRMTPTGVVSVFDVTTNPFVGGAAVEAVTVGPDGNMWFADFKCAVGRSTLSGSIVEFVEPQCGTPFGITAGPDGNLWFTDPNLSEIGRISISGSITMFTLPSSMANPALITAGPDGNLWFTEPGTNAVGRITTSGAVTEFPLRTANSHPYGITMGPDGDLWFTEVQGIARITPDGAITEFHHAYRPVQIATGPDGNLWFTEPGSPDRIGRYTIRGSHFTDVMLPEPNSEPMGIAPGPVVAGQRGTMWFTEYTGNRIGEIAT